MIPPEEPIEVCTICEANAPEVCPECAQTELTLAQAIAPELHLALEQLVEAIDYYHERRHDGVYRIGQAMRRARGILKRLPVISQEPRLLPRTYGVPGPEDIRV